LFAEGEMGILLIKRRHTDVLRRSLYKRGVERGLQGREMGNMLSIGKGAGRGWFLEMG